MNLEEKIKKSPQFQLKGLDLFNYRIGVSLGIGAIIVKTLYKHFISEKPFSEEEWERDNEVLIEFAILRGENPRRYL